VALRLFSERGFDETTVDEIAAEAGVSRRTFFRYFPSKNAVVMGEFDEEIEIIRGLLAATDPATPMMDAVREAVVAANHYRAEDVPELRSRMNLLGTVPALSAASTVQYAAWEKVISEFCGDRLGQPPDSLYPLAVGRATLAVCRSAYDRWAERADQDLQRYLDAALRALAVGFDEEKLPPPALP
jgi:TetR/AcrR family transcriptional regulator, regulator of mycofactocin system